MKSYDDSTVRGDLSKMTQYHAITRFSSYDRNKIGPPNSGFGTMSLGTFESIVNSVNNSSATTNWQSKESEMRNRVSNVLSFNYCTPSGACIQSGGEPEEEQGGAFGGQ